MNPFDVFAVAAKTGWLEDRILFMPLVRLSLYQHCLLLRTGLRAKWNSVGSEIAHLYDKLEALRVLWNTPKEQLKAWIELDPTDHKSTISLIGKLDPTTHKTMAYDVKFTVPTRTLGKTDISFVVRTKGEILGTLQVSRGDLEWFPKNAKKGRKVSWEKFSDFAEKQK